MADNQPIHAQAAPQELVGTKIAGLELLSLTRFKGRLAYECRCDCGKTKVIVRYRILSGQTKSCGCLQEKMRKAGRPTHGLRRKAEYPIYRAMVRRCYDDRIWNYCDYGGRGIRVCDRWLESVANFYADMGPRPSKRHSLEREDNEGNYEPGNVVWALPKQQCRNRRSNRLITIGGETKTLAEWSEISGVGFGTIRRRIILKWPESRWLIPPTKGPTSCKA